jgi:hypothetical protein
MIPKNANKIALRPLALGEKTGHHHSLVCLDPERGIDEVAEMYEAVEDEKIKTYLRVIEDECVALVHQEHKAHAIPAGEYEVFIQREMTDWGLAPVKD